MNKVPNVKLRDGHSMPGFGLGTWRAQPGDVYKAIQHAIDVGIRHFDCAMLYGNEEEIGKAIRAKIQDGLVKREDLFITSKLWCNTMRPNLVEPTLKKTLKNFGLDYLDLYLIHWPMGFKEGGEYYPLDNTGMVIVSDVDYVDTWKAMEKVQKLGLTKSIGVSNFNTKQLGRLWQNVTVKPVVNQVEYHPYLNQKKLYKVCMDNDIVIVAYAPLGSNDRPWAKDSDVKLLDDPRIKLIGQTHGKTTAQVILRYLVQLGIVPIPKSSNRNRMEENFNIFDFELSPHDMDILDRMDRGVRYHHHGEAVHHPNYPFNEE